MSDDQFLRDLLTDVDPARPEFRVELRDHLSREWHGRTTIAPLTAARPTAPPRNRAWWSIGTAAAVLALVVAGVALLDRPDDPAATTVVTAVDFPALTTTFVSPRNGFSVSYFDRGEGTVIPATQLWGFGQRVDDGFDVVDTGLAAVLKVASADASEAGREQAPIDEWVDEYLSEDSVLSDDCGVPRSQQAEIAIDGHEGRVAECPNHIEATVVFGGRLYLFTLTHDRSDARAVFDTFIATVDLTPETAVGFPAMTTTFVSPTYGYSFDYHDRGGLQTATEVWDASEPPLEIFGWDPRFDGVETGLGAYFQAASTDIPEGVSIDDWVDTHVTPRSAGGCGVPRSEQEEIFIDGQPGRKAECDHSEATVVAGGRLYLFIGPNDDRHWFDGWIDTIELTPETAVP
jgi:hypothetical protein